jgi:cytoskeletal protein CcmA (bactofilin family)
MLFKKRKEASEITSVLGEGTEVSGEISLTTGLLVEGAVKGKVRSETILVIGATGKVEADVSVRRLCIDGEFRGTIHASDRVEIRKDAKVFGEIYSPCLIIEAGALFEGRCNMNDAKAAEIRETRPAIKPADPAKKTAGT